MLHLKVQKRVCKTLHTVLQWKAFFAFQFYTKITLNFYTTSGYDGCYIYSMPQPPNHHYEAQTLMNLIHHPIQSYCKPKIWPSPSLFNKLWIIRLKFRPLPTCLAQATFKHQTFRKKHGFHILRLNILPTTLEK